MQVEVDEDVIQPQTIQRQLGAPMLDGKTIRLEEEDGTMRLVRVILQDLNQLMWDRIVLPEDEQYEFTKSASYRRGSLPGGDGGFHEQPYWIDGQHERWPAQWAWICCFAVTGSNEGYYVHIEVIDKGEKGQPGRRKLLGLAKCYSLDLAWQYAAEAGKLLGA